MCLLHLYTNTQIHMILVKYFACAKCEIRAFAQVKSKANAFGEIKSVPSPAEGGFHHESDFTPR